MVLAAVALIFLGLLCLGYVALTLMRRPADAPGYGVSPYNEALARPAGDWNRVAPAGDPSQGRPYWTPPGNAPPPPRRPAPGPAAPARPAPPAWAGAYPGEAMPYASVPANPTNAPYPEAAPPAYGDAPSYEEWMRRHAPGPRPFSGNVGEARMQSPGQPAQPGQAPPQAREDRPPAEAYATPDHAPEATATPEAREAKAGGPWTRIPSYESVSRLDTRRLAESLRTIANREAIEERRERTEQLVVAGTLYLDHGRRVDRLAGRSEEIPPRLFAELKRAGQGSLVAEGGSFRIHCGPASYHYPASELDQIIFHAAGIALIPTLPDRPAPVFLTEESETLKAYVKKRARQASL